MEPTPPILDHTRDSLKDRQSVWQQPARRAFVGMLGFPTLALGVFLSYEWVASIPWFVHFHHQHPSDVNFGSDVFEMVILLTITLVIDFVGVRWCAIAIRGRMLRNRWSIEKPELNEKGAELSPAPESRQLR